MPIGDRETEYPVRDPHTVKGRMCSRCRCDWISGKRPEPFGLDVNFKILTGVVDPKGYTVNLCQSCGVWYSNLGDMA